MLGIPPAKDTDAEDVVWGLQTAETLWKRGERVDAIVWLRRAAQAADEAKDDDRALELARSAAGLSDWMAAQPLGANNAPPVALPVPTHVPNVPSYAPEEGQMSIEVDMDDADGARGPLPDIAMPAPPQAPPPMSAPPQAPRPMPPQSRPPSQRTMQMAEPLSADDGAHERPDDMLQTPIVPYAQHDDEERRPRTISAPPADKVHAGMFNPWDDRAPPPPPPVPVAPPPPGTPRFANDDEVITSLQPQELQQQRAHALAAFLAGGSGQSEAPLPLSPVAWAEEVNAEAVKPAPPRPAPPRPPPLPARAMKPPVPSAPAPPRYPSSSATRVTPPPPSPTQLMLQPPPRVPPARHAEAPPVVEAAPSERALPTEEQCEEAAAAVEAASAAEATRGAEASSAAEAESAEAAAAGRARAP